MRQAALQEYGGGFHPLGNPPFPNQPEEILSLLEAGVEVAIATDAYLPLRGAGPFPGKLYGTGSLMLLAQPAMVLLGKKGWIGKRLPAPADRRPRQGHGMRNRF